MAIRETIADYLEPSLWEGSVRADALRLADDILAIPEVGRTECRCGDDAKYCYNCAGDMFTDDY